jgi:hypothetical protein
VCTKVSFSYSKWRAEGGPPQGVAQGREPLARCVKVTMASCPRKVAGALGTGYIVRGWVRDGWVLGRVVDIGMDGEWMNG